MTIIVVGIGQGGMMNLIDIKKKKGKDLGREMRRKNTLIAIKEVSINQAIIIMKIEEDQEVDEMRPGQGQISTIPEPASSPVKTIPLEDGSVLEIHGDQRRGFTIHNGARSMPSSFKELDEAEMAVNLYRARRPVAQPDSGADYVEEAK